MTVRQIAEVAWGVCIWCSLLALSLLLVVALTDSSNRAQRQIVWNEAVENGHAEIFVEQGKVKYRWKGQTTETQIEKVP